jgi:tetratricopeptide (TPR) repeat protein
MTDPAEAVALGRQQQQAGNLLEAEQWYRYVLQWQPWHEEALRRLGALCLDSGRFGEAVAFFRQVLYANPQLAEVHNDLGIALAQQRLFQEALTSFQQAIRVQPNYAKAYNNIALVFLSCKQPVEAEGWVRRAIEQRPDLADAHCRLGDTLRAQGRPAEALDCYRQALRLQPDYVEAHNCLGIALAHAGRESDAVDCFRRAIELQPNYLKAHSNLGTALQNLGRFEEALRVYEQALREFPDEPQLRRNRGLIWLRQGDLERGWPEYEWRLRCPDVPPTGLTQPRWHGEPLNGRTILLYAEQGLGDAIQFIRYAPLVRQRGGSVVVVCHAGLTRLLSGFRGVAQLVASGAPLPPFDTQAPLLSLPGIFRTSLDSVPADVPYLTANPQLINYWGARLSAYPGIKIGITWQGNPGHPDDYRRSAPLAVFSPLAKLPGVHLFSLQKGSASEQLAQVATSWPITDLGPQLDEKTGIFMDTAAVLKHLDMMVTVDTAIVHVAGALAAPVYMALAHVADWRWLLERDDTPWYPTVRLFRQREPGQWSDVFERIAAAIMQSMRDRTKPSRKL